MSKARKLTFRNSKEQNTKVLEKAVWDHAGVDGSEGFKQMREGIMRESGLDIKDEKRFPVMNPDFSFKEAHKRMKEANASTGFVQLLRAGVQTICNNMYNTIETTFEEWAHVVSSDKEVELYAPLHGLDFPREVGRGEKYPEAAMLGLDLELRNRKYGEIFPVEKELLMNDQTGQVQNQVRLMAEYAKQVIEVLAYAKLGSPSGGSTYGNMSVAVSETKPSGESNWPWSTALIGGGATTGASKVAFTLANFQTARTSLRKQKNLLGLKMSVKPNRLILSPYYELDAATILHSNYYPAGAQSAGVTGGAFAQNFLKGIANLTIADFLFDNAGASTGLSKAWYLTDDTKPAFVVQIREPNSVIQEAPDAGASFESDIVRWKMSLQANADFIDSRFFWQGSDGSV